MPDYQFFVVFSDDDSSAMPEYFSPSLIDEFNKRQWFGLIGCESRSSIVIPNRAKIDFDLPCKISFINKENKNVWHK
jgi:hypothetical protein